MNTKIYEALSNLIDLPNNIMRLTVVLETDCKPIIKVVVQDCVIPRIYETKIYTLEEPKTKYTLKEIK